MQVTIQLVMLALLPNCRQLPPYFVHNAYINSLPLNTLMC